MWIYKIINKINNKVYIGQTIRPVEQRFHRYITDALSNRLDTHLARAIRFYGKDNFSFEIIDQASNQEELTEKEYFWITEYNSVNEGYNETNSKNKCGGNTYSQKTPEEINQIASKIRESKIGGKNPNAVKVKCKSIITGEEKHFGSLSEMQQFFGSSNHSFITKRCQGKTTCLYRKEWLIAYEDRDYPSSFTINKGNRKAKRVLVKDLNSLREQQFESFSSAEKYFGLSKKYFSGKAYAKGNHFFKGNFEITVLD